MTPAKISTVEGEIAPAAFALFKKTEHLEVVIELEPSSGVVLKLHEEWDRLRDRLVLGEEILGILDRKLAARHIDKDVVFGVWDNHHR